MIVVAVTATLFTSACGNDSPAGPSGVDIPSLVVTDVLDGHRHRRRRRAARVTVHYTGWLYTATGDHRGTRFDSSRDRNQPLRSSSAPARSSAAGIRASSA